MSERKLLQLSFLRFAAAVTFIIVVTLAAYIPAMRGGFVWDDDAYVADNPLMVIPDGLYRIWFSKEQTSQYFPLTFTTFRLEHKLWGLNPSGYHITNIILHIINSLLLWRLLRLLDVPGAWLAAAIFALHPVQVESVAWITERKNVLMTLFFFMSLLAWVRFMEKPAIYFYFLSLVLYALALFSKTTACTLPAALVLILWIKRIPIGKRRWLQITPFVVLGLAMGIFVAWWEHHLQGTGRLKLGLNIIERLLLAARALWFYVGKLIWPTKLTFSYPKWDISWTQPVQYLWLIAWAIVGWGMWRWREKLGRRVIAGIVFFVATLSPMLGFIPLYTFRYTYVADHYQYVASAGLIAIVAALGCRAAAKIRLLPIVAAIILAGYGVISRQQCYVYGSMETLWRDILAKNPDSWMAYNNLGRELKSQGRIIEAIDCYHRALKIKPDHANAYYNLGIAYDKLGCYNDAIDAYKQTARIEPNDAEAYYRAGVACDKAGRYNEAVEAFKQAVGIRPDYAEALSNLGVAYGKLGLYAEAINACKQAVGVRPDYAAAHYNLGLAYFKAGDRNSALNEYKILKALDPQKAKNLFNVIQP